LAEFFQGGGIPVGNICTWYGRGTDNHIIRWLKAEYGLTRNEIESIELLTDKTIVRLLARRGIKPAPMFNRSRRYVAAYLEAMAARAARKERKPNVPARVAA
jgi:hypothetical protein